MLRGILLSSGIGFDCLHGKYCTFLGCYPSWYDTLEDSVLLTRAIIQACCNCFYYYLTGKRHSRYLLRPISALVVMNRTLGLRAVGLVRRTCVNGHSLALLRTPIDVLIVPDLAKHSVAVVGGVLSGSGGVESWAGASNERDTAVLLCQGVSEVGVGVRGAV